MTNGLFVTVLEWSGTFLGLLGAYLLALNTNVSKYGWMAFLLANFALIGFSILLHHYGLLVQQLGFMATSILGIHRSGLFVINRK
jgi:hypothetical protein